MFSLKVCIFFLLVALAASQDSGCGNPRYMTAPSGGFTSMNFDGSTEYDRNAFCEWNIDVANAAKVVELSFDFFDVEGALNCMYDSVKVYDGVDATAPLLDNLCGHNLPFPVISTANSMYVTFQSDLSVQWFGFSALYTERDPPITCDIGYYLCGDDATGSCNAMMERCDGKDQCVATGEDELGCPGNVATCGEPAIPPNTQYNIKVVNGTEAVPHSWPWQISLQQNKGHYCGGSVLNSKWVITAAHCIGLLVDQIYTYDVNCGEHNLTVTESSERQYPVEKLFVHENYNAFTIDNDVAMVKVLGEIEMSAEISEVCLPAQGQDFADGDECYITGWGETEGTGDNRALHQARSQIIDTLKCNHPDAYNGTVTDNMICAGYLEGGVDTCQGDSGGPLVWKDVATNKWILAGLTSWGEGCAEPMKPGVYTKVSNFVNWVNDVMYNNP